MGRIAWRVLSLSHQGGAGWDGLTGAERACVARVALAWSGETGISKAEREFFDELMGRFGWCA